MKNFKGVITALVTPFKNGEVDYLSLEKLVSHQLDNGIEGFVVNGTTGESPTLSKAEVETIFKKVRSWAGSSIPIIVGTGSNSTAKTEELSEAAEEWGADAVLVVVPYYNKPPQRGLVRHFTEVAKSVSIPVILYNVPGRTITALSAESIRELSKVQNIVGVKEASGNIDFASEISRLVSPEFVLLSGDDGTYVDFLGAGGHGVISVASHIIPQEMVAWKAMASQGKLKEAKEEIKQFSKLIDGLFVEANPIPVKMALYFMGLIASPELRLPLVTMDDAMANILKQEMKTAGVL